MIPAAATHRVAHHLPDVIDAICLDLDNTLIDRDAAFRAWLDAWIDPWCDAQTRASVVEGALRRDARGHGDRIALCSWLADQHNTRADASTHAPIRGAQVWATLRAQIGQHTACDPRVCDLVRGLQRRFRVAIVTNGGSENQRAKLRHARLDDLLPEHRVIVSGEVGADKPDGLIYAIACARLDAAPARTLFVGDHPIHDVLAPQSWNMYTTWITAGRTWDTPCARPDHQIERILDLPELLRGA